MKSLTIILSILPTILLIAKIITSFTPFLKWVEKYKKSSISEIKEVLENEALTSAEKMVLNEKLKKEQFKRIFRIDLNKGNRNKIIDTELQSQGKLTYSDFNKAKINLIITDNNIRVDEPKFISYEIQKNFQQWFGLLLLLLGLCIFLYYVYNALFQLTGDVNPTLSFMGYELVLFSRHLEIGDFVLMSMSPLYVITGFMKRDQYQETLATLKIKKYFTDNRPLE